MNQDGSRVLLRDVAKIELGGENYDIIAEFTANRLPVSGIKLETGANALDTAAQFCAELAKMEPVLPSGLKNRLPVRHHAVRENLLFTKWLKRWSKRSTPCSWLCICSCRTSARR
ncbi:efflux RND transporter permease subunit [Shigella flexneri]